MTDLDTETVMSVALGIIIGLNFVFMTMMAISAWPIKSRKFFAFLYLVIAGGFFYSQYYIVATGFLLLSLFTLFNAFMSERFKKFEKMKFKEWQEHIKKELEKRGGDG